MKPYMKLDGEDGSTWTVTKATAANLDKLVEDGVEYLPKNWRELVWYKCKQDPCLSGDDVFAAYDEVAKVGYFLFDNCVTGAKWDKNSFKQVTAKGANRLLKNQPQLKAHKDFIAFACLMDDAWDAYLKEAKYDLAS